VASTVAGARQRGREGGGGTTTRQGVTQKARAGKKYNDIPWRVSLLERRLNGG